MLSCVDDGEKIVFWSNVCAGDTVLYFGILSGTRLLGVTTELRLVRQWQNYDGIWCEYANIPKWDEPDESLDFEIDFAEEKLCFSTSGEDYWYDGIWNPNEKYLTRWRVINSRGIRTSSDDIANCLCSFKDKNEKTYFFITASEEQSVDVWNSMYDSGKIDIEEDNTKYQTIGYGEEINVDGIGKFTIDTNIICKMENISKKLEIDKIYFLNEKKDLEMV